jgi:hypothetical protein
MLYNSLVEVYTKDIKLAKCDMDMVSLLMLKEVNIVANGIKIKWKDVEHFIMIMDRSLIKDNGKMISLMDMEYFIIKFPHFLVNSSIIKTYI